MDVATWTTISQLLDQALDLPAAARAAWVERLAPEYDGVKAQLRALLTDASAMDRDAFLATLPKFATAVGEAPPGDDSRAGAMVGPYRLVRVIASGGQGSVWLAERADGLLARPVAVKLPHGLAFRPGLAERMGRERDILARLAHPHIARLYDAGLSATGEPYLALEYVEGEAIDRHVQTRSLDVRACVRLFQQVTDAVAFAHGRLVIHRDLKPSNILVTGDGDVRLLDFGIAALLADGGVDSTLTRDAGRAMTLAYASPEQVRQQPLGVATDIYSLGVVLFELLTGARPYTLARQSAAALEDAVLTQEPRRASEVAPAAARRMLAGDLETILAKALKKDPEARYPSVEALADDLARWLEGRPVLARPDSRAYRLRKFVGRHRVAVAASAAALAAVLTGAGAAIWQAGVARAERDAALLQQARAQASSGFLQSLLQQAGVDTPLTATQLLDRGAAQLDADTTMDPAVLAFLQYEISTHYLRFNQTDREVALLTKSAAGARRAGDRPLEAAAQCAAAWSLAQRDLAEAKARLAGGLEAMHGLAAPPFRVRADCLRARGRVLDADGQRADAIALLETELPRLTLDTEADWSRRSLVRTQLTDLYRQDDRVADALRMNEDGLADVRRHGQAGTLNEFGGMNNVAAALARLGEHRAALAIYRELRTWLDRGVFPVTPLAVQSNIGLAELRIGNPAEALRLADAERLADVKAGNPLLAAVADLLASRALLALDRPDEAARRLDAAEAFLRQNARGNARVLVQASLVRAEILAATGPLAPAIALVEQTLAQLGYPARRNELNLDRALRLMAQFRLAQGDAAGAEVAAGDAVAVATRIARDRTQSAEVGEAALLRVRALLAMGRASETAADVALAADALTHGLGADHALTRAAMALPPAATSPR